MKFFATTAKGMEQLLVDELRALGAIEIEPQRAGAAFVASLETAYRVCLWSRVANRVLLPLKSFDAADEKALYAGIKAIRWSEHLSEKQSLAVDFAIAGASSRADGPAPTREITSVRRIPGRAPQNVVRTVAAGISNSHYAALKVKDAIVDQFRSITGERPSVDVERPDVRVNVHLANNRATVSLDLSGDSLHLRGYREEGMRAPLKENLAAAILYLAGWPEKAKAGAGLVDPMCGSGTLPLEAAFMACDVAPGLKREYFGFLGWKQHDASAWQKLRAEASERAQAGLERKIGPIVGYDGDFRAVRACLDNLERAGLRGKVHFEKRELELCEVPVVKAKGQTGVVVVNPPYGERLGEETELKPLYGRLGDTFKKKFAGWNAYLITSNPELAKSVGLAASRRHVLFNGALECRLLEYQLYAGTQRKTP